MSLVSDLGRRSVSEGGRVDISHDPKAVSGVLFHHGGGNGPVEVKAGKAGFRKKFESGYDIATDMEEERAGECLDELLVIR